MILWVYQISTVSVFFDVIFADIETDTHYDIISSMESIKNGGKELFAHCNLLQNDMLCTECYFW